MCYIEQALHIGLVGWCGDSPSDLYLEAYADADFASDYNTARSTTGGILFLAGPDTRFVLSCASKKQGCVSRSTPESETIACSHVLRVFGIPAILLWSAVLNRPV